MYKRSELREKAKRRKLSAEEMAAMLSGDVVDDVTEYQPGLVPEAAIRRVPGGWRGSNPTPLGRGQSPAPPGGFGQTTPRRARPWAYRQGPRADLSTASSILPTSQAS